jgi:hypothetical protein
MPRAVQCRADDPFRKAPISADVATWLKLLVDGTIENFVPRAEIGQCAAIAFRQILRARPGLPA